MRSPGMLGLVLAALVSGCALEASETAPPPDAEPTQKAEHAFDASLFEFSMWGNDSGPHEAGGWQHASTVLKFVDTRSAWMGVNGADKWDCRITIRMPIRHRIYGIISPELAAQWSADAAVVAADQVMKSRPKWMPALFCPKFAERMTDLFKKAPRGPIGARVTSP